MASAFDESPAGLVYRERLSPWTRGFAVAIGLAMGVIPVPFIRHASWREPTAATLLAAACVALACLAGLAFVAIGLTGSRHIVFDAAQRRLLVTRRGPLGARRSEIGFEQVQRVEVVMREAVDDPPYYLVVLSVAGHRRPMELGSFPAPGEAAFWQQRIQAVLQRGGQAPGPSDRPSRPPADLPAPSTPGARPDLHGQVPP